MENKIKLYEVSLLIDDISGHLIKIVEELQKRTLSPETFGDLKILHGDLVQTKIKAQNLFKSYYKEVQS